MFVARIFRITYRLEQDVCEGEVGGNGSAAKPICCGKNCFRRQSRDKWNEMIFCILQLAKRYLYKDVELIKILTPNNVRIENDQISCKIMMRHAVQ